MTWALKPLRIFMTKHYTVDKPMRGGQLLRMYDHVIIIDINLMGSV